MIPDRFLIFARPRSRTAWTANFLTQPLATFCFHEGLADCSGSWLELKRRMDLMRASAVGNADTGMIHEVEAALSTFPEAKLVMLTGGELSWRIFIQKNKIPSALVSRIDDDYRRAKDILKGKALFLPCGSLGDPRVAEELWTHCTGRLTTYQPERHRMLRDLNVQVVPESLRRRLGIPSQS